MARLPIGEWEPPTNEEMEAATSFEQNEALQGEVSRDLVQWVQGIEEPQAYEINGIPFELEPKVLKGFVESKPEESE